MKPIDLYYCESCHNSFPHSHQCPTTEKQAPNPGDVEAADAQAKNYADSKYNKGSGDWLRVVEAYKVAFHNGCQKVRAEMQAEIVLIRSMGWRAVSGWYDAIGLLNSNRTFEQHSRNFDYGACHTFFMHGDVLPYRERVNAEQKMATAQIDKIASLEKALSERERSIADARLEGAYIQQQLECAKRFLNNSDPHMANYCLRDLKICEEMGRTDLLWAFHNGNPCEREIKDEIEKIAAYLKESASKTEAGVE